MTCVGTAVEQDEFLGDGEYEHTFGDEVRELPECRNDREFVFVKRQYARHEGMTIPKALPSSLCVCYAFDCVVANQRWLVL